MPKIFEHNYIQLNPRIRAFFLYALDKALASSRVCDFVYRLSSDVQLLWLCSSHLPNGIYRLDMCFLTFCILDGCGYLTLAVVIAVIGFVLVVVGAKLMNFPPSVSVGLLSGSLTSSPILAATQGCSVITELFRYQQGSLLKR